MTRIARFERPVAGASRIRVYDNGGRTMDRYTVLFEDLPTYDERRDREYDRPRPYGPRFGLGMSEAPSSPQGVGYSEYIAPPQTWGTGATDRRIPYDTLPDGCKRLVLDILETEVV